MSGFMTQYLRGDGRPTHDLSNLMLGYNPEVRYDRGCRLSDIDGVLDSRGKVCFVEMKHPHEGSDRGQRRLYEALARLGAVMELTEYPDKQWSGRVFSLRWGFDWVLPDVAAIEQFGFYWAKDANIYISQGSTPEGALP